MAADDQPASGPAIRFENVSKSYGADEAVDDLNISIEQGELVVLLGPSGCGKTTTLRMINRLVEPTSGTIYVNGSDVARQDLQSLRRGIGYVIQAAGLFPHLTCEQNVEVVPKLLGWSKAKRRERARELLALVGLEPNSYAERYPRELSGGEQQRVGVARALAADPPIMLMDEPFGAVDPLTRDRLQGEFQDLQRSLRKTVVFVTHDLDEAVRLADRICLMKDGGVEQFAAPEELLSRPATAFVEKFVGPRRAMKRLGRLRVGELVRPGTTALEHAGTVGVDVDLRTALAELLRLGVTTLAVVGTGGERLGELRLADIVALGDEA